MCALSRLVQREIHALAQRREYDGVWRKVVGVGLMEEMVNAFLTCEYEGGERHDRRIAKIKAIEEKYCK